MQTGACAGDTPNLPNQCETRLENCISTCGGVAGVANFECTNTNNNETVDSDCQCGTPPDNSTSCAANETYGSFNGSWGCYPNGSGDSDNSSDDNSNNSSNDGDGNNTDNNNNNDDDVDSTNNGDDNTSSNAENNTTNNVTNNTYNTTNNTYNETADIDLSPITSSLSETNSKIDSLSAATTSALTTTNSTLAAQNSKIDALVTEAQFSAQQLAAVNEGLNTSNAQLQSLNDGQGSLLTGLSTLNDTATETNTGISNVVDGVSTLGDVVEAGNDEIITVLTDLDTDNDIEQEQQTGHLEAIEQNTADTATNISTTNDKLNNIESGLNNRLDAVNQNLLNIKEAIPDSASTEKVVDQTASDAAIQEFSKGVKKIEENLNTSVQETGVKLEERASSLREIINTARDYFMPTLTTTGGCDLGYVDLFGRQVLLTMCPYMDLFVLIGNILFFLANYRAVFILFDWIKY